MLEMFMLALGYDLITGALPWNISLLLNKDHFYIKFQKVKSDTQDQPTSKFLT